MWRWIVVGVSLFILLLTSRLALATSTEARDHSHLNVTGSILSLPMSYSPGLTFGLHLGRDTVVLGGWSLEDFMYLAAFVGPAADDYGIGARANDDSRFEVIPFVNVGLRRFIGNSLNLSAMAGRSVVRTNSSYKAGLALGNQWQGSRGMIFGIDWIGANAYRLDRPRGEPLHFVMPYFMRFSLGFSF